MPPALPVSIYDSRAHPRASSVSVFLSPGFLFSSFSLSLSVVVFHMYRCRRKKEREKLSTFTSVFFLHALTLLQLSVSQTNARSFKRDNQIFLRFRLWETRRGEEQRLVDDRDALYVRTYVRTYVRMYT